MSGFTNSPTLPVTAGALSSAHAANLEGLLVVYSPDHSGRRYLSGEGMVD